MTHEEQVEMARDKVAKLRIAIDAFNIAAAQCVQAGASVLINIGIGNELKNFWLDHRGIRVSLEKAESITKVDL